MRYNLSYKSKTNSGSKNYGTFYSPITDPFADSQLAGFLEGLDLVALANNAHVQVSAVLDDVYDDEIELPNPAELVDEKDVICYLGNSEDPNVLFVLSFGHIKADFNLASSIRSLVEGQAGGLYSSPFTTRDGVILDRVIKVVERQYSVVHNG